MDSTTTATPDLRARIGAMLVAPLMTPIVELALALLVATSDLLLRSLVRSGVSVVFVAGSAALITLALPLQEPTEEIRPCSTF